MADPRNASGTAVIEARGLTLLFDGAGPEGAPAPVLRDVSFTLEPGRVLGVVGESGAGKSMLGRAIAGQLPPGFRVAGGDLRFFDRSLPTLDFESRRALLGRDIAFIPQEPLTALNPVFTIATQFTEHLARLDIPAAQRRARVIELLASVHLHDPSALLDRYPHQLSGGMCQRVLIAMAFAGNPKLVVADEPTTALDVTIQARIMAVMAEMMKTHGTAVLLITHDLRLAAHTCDDLLVLYAGTMMERGPARAVFTKPAHPYTRCLQLANPPLTGERRELMSLPEHMPGLAQLASLRGCRFASRCPVVVPACNEVEPSLTPARDLAGSPGVTAGNGAASSMSLTGDSRLVRCSLAQRTHEIRPGTRAVNRDHATGPTILRAEGFAKTYPARRRWLRRTGADVHALKPVTFELRENEFLGVVGESGSGKSTLAKLVAGLEAPTAGTLTLAGQPLDFADPASRRRRLSAIQMVFQDPQSALNPRRRVASIVTQPLEAALLRNGPVPSWPERLARAREVLASLNMPGETALRWPAQLSGGQRQRVNIARALCAAPRVLVADEIVSGLDVSVQAQLLTLLAGLKAARAASLLFISHDLSVVRWLCDRVLVMHRGEVVEEGPTDAVFAAPAHPYTRRLLAAVPPEDLSARWEAAFGEEDDNP